MNQMNKNIAAVVSILLLALNFKVINSEAKFYPPDKKEKSVYYYIIKDSENEKPGKVSAKLLNKTAAIKIPETVKINGNIYVVTEVTGLCYPDYPDSSAKTDAYKCRKNQKTTEIILPKTIKRVEKGAFTNFTKLKKITVDKNNRKFKSVNGALLSRDGRILYGVPTLKGTYRVPYGVTVITSRTFAYSKVEKVILPKSCRKIKDRAFYRAGDLKVVKNLSRVKKIGSNVFYGTELKGLY